MNGPERVSWLECYIVQPIESIRNVLSEYISTMWIKLKGGWYCEYCHKIHSRRVYKYPYLEGKRDITTGPLRGNCNKPDKLVCSLARDAVLHEGWKPKSRGD